MKILIAHNAYQQRGGEDMVFEQESTMLAASGFDVRRFTVRNDHIQGIAGKIAAARSVISNTASVKALYSEVDAFTPDIVHFHNFFPTLSPAAVDAVAQRGIPVVLTLHNYRLICAGGMLLRAGKVCEDCLAHSKLPGVVHGCYRGSHIGSALVGGMGTYFKQLLKKHRRHITLIALTEFAKSRFVADGFLPEQIVVRGNVIADPGTGLDVREKRIVYVGRLSSEKGVDTLLNATQHIDGTIEIIGDGPERAKLETMAGSNVIFRGQLPSAQVLECVKSAAAMAVPSRWYEGFPMVVLEAMATGTPILASRIGSLAEIVAHEDTGLLLPPNAAPAWQEGIARILQSPPLARTYGGNARMRFLEKHSFATGVESLTRIYTNAISKSA
jgi:glycosyltransferase involved in cell wall biosynthesis